MTSQTKIPLKAAILVRQFPNIVQTYILNHIISLKNLGVDTTIIAVSNPKQTEIHPTVNNYNLISETAYIDTVKIGGLKQIFTLPLYSPRYLGILKKLIFSNLWKKYGVKYGIKAILTSKSLTAHDFDIVHSHTLISSYEYLYLKEIFQTPIITTFHGFEPKNSKTLAIEKTQLVLKQTDAFIVTLLKNN